MSEGEENGGGKRKGGNASGEGESRRRDRAPRVPWADGPVPRMGGFYLYRKVTLTTHKSGLWELGRGEANRAVRVGPWSGGIRRGEHATQVIDRTLSR